MSVPCPPEVLDLPAEPLETGRGQVIRAGGPTVAIGAGPIVLAELLNAPRCHGSTSPWSNLPWLNRVDPAWLAALDRRRRVRGRASRTTTCTAGRPT